MRLRRSWIRTLLTAMLLALVVGGPAVGTAYANSRTYQAAAASLMRRYDHTWGLQPIFGLSRRSKRAVLDAIGETDPTAKQLGVVTAGILRRLTELKLDLVEEDEDLSFLNYCQNLERLTLSCIDDVPEGIIALRSLRQLTVDGDTIDVARLRFLALNDGMTLSLAARSQIRHTDLIPLFTGIDQLEVSVLNGFNLSLQELDFVERLTLIGRPYDIAIFVTREGCTRLKEQGVTLRMQDFAGNSIARQVRAIDRELETIVTGLDISAEATEQERADAALAYVIERCTYDSEVKLLTDSYEAPDTMEFYREGYLWGVFELDTQICGNYSALFAALVNRLGLKGCLTGGFVGSWHSWNLVVQDGSYYYYDPTSLDSWQAKRDDGSTFTALDALRQDVSTEREQLERSFAYARPAATTLSSYGDYPPYRLEKHLLQATDAEVLTSLFEQ